MLLGVRLSCTTAGTRGYTYSISMLLLRTQKYLYLELDYLLMIAVLLILQLHHCVASHKTRSMAAWPTFAAASLMFAAPSATFFAAAEAICSLVSSSGGATFWVWKSWIHFTFCNLSAFPNIRNMFNPAKLVLDVVLRVFRRWLIVIAFVARGSKEVEACVGLVVLEIERIK